jgi:hypothetical protein
MSGNFLVVEQLVAFQGVGSIEVLIFEHSAGEWYAGYDYKAAMVSEYARH